MSKSEPATTTKPKRDRHGFRGLPPPVTDFSLASLADDALLTEFEVAAILRVSTNTLGSWRQQGGHPLRWLALPNGFVRYTAAALRAYLASGKPRKRPLTAIQAQADAAPAPRRRKARPRATAEESLAPESSS